MSVGSRMQAPTSLLSAGKRFEADCHGPVQRAQDRALFAGQGGASGAPLNRVTRQDLIRILRQACGGAAGGNREILEVIGSAAYELPLPPGWSEEVDDSGTVYFWNHCRSEATWQHPLISVFSSTLVAATEMVRQALTIGDVVAAIAGHLKDAEAEASRSLKVWSGPHVEDGSAHGDGSFGSGFYHNESTGESSWENPLEALQYELYARHWLFSRLLQHLNGNLPDDAPLPSQCGPASPYRMDEYDVGLLSAFDFPDEMRAYSTWIRAALASAESAPGRPAVVVGTPHPTRPPLPPLTSMSLKQHRVADREARARSRGHSRGRMSSAASTPSLPPLTGDSRGRSGRSSARAGSREYPSLALYPLRRSMSVAFHAPAEHHLQESSLHGHWPPQTACHRDAYSPSRELHSHWSSPCGWRRDCEVAPQFQSRWSSPCAWRRKSDVTTCAQAQAHLQGCGWLLTRGGRSAALH
mmetsp:Transcript_120677/g.341228  ORF Transcript_120677/g.341228 Transcript_120677/m.341228 type:complete len:469 (-) Transcript_120677:157-1563(-)